MLDGYSVVSVALGSQSVSGFFRDLDAFVSIKRALSDSFDHIEQTSASTEAEKDALQERLAEQEQLRQVAQVAKQSLQTQEDQKKKLLSQTKGIEANYQKIIAVTKKTAAQIRTELFALAGGGGQISLPTAITLAKQAGAATGVRPAFILGIMRQETNLGANVGQCLLTNVPDKGNGKGKNTGTFIRRVMKASRDVDPFMAITAALRSEERRVDNLDAFTAVALYMTDLGAALQTPSAERTAALKYFAGGYYKNPRFAPYGDSVMQFAADFQQEIDILSGY
ncbi:MAG: Uncharacterized protein G01um101491_171 [Parcubacteria group bacterium Gr01-1014_91]|nr:MAG: Uncharacterized protein G01um101491_171 [Parcubacteria group bacterium Gr01-1014_91]